MENIGFNFGSTSLRGIWETRTTVFSAIITSGKQMDQKRELTEAGVYRRRGSYCIQKARSHVQHTIR